MNAGRVAAACSVAALVGMLVWAVPAGAYTSQAFAKPGRLTQIASGDGEGKVLATLRLTGLTVGEVRNIRSEIVVGDSKAGGAPGRVAVIHKITCQPSGGATLPDMRIVSSRNLLAGAGDVRLILRLLITAAHAGDFECLLRAYTLDGLSLGDESAALRSGFVADIDGGHPHAGTAQRFVMSPDSHNTASLLGIDTPGKQLNHLYGYTPPPGATSFIAVGDFLATSCYGSGGNACPAGTYPASGTAQVYSRIVATPSLPAPGCVLQATIPTTVAVSRYVHHLRISHTLNVTLPATGCGTWTINIFAKDNGGTLPFVVHLDGRYSVVYARPALSN